MSQSAAVTTSTTTKQEHFALPSPAPAVRLAEALQSIVLSDQSLAPA